MSDPVSKIEIEDVLSSIRRLVSEEKRIEPRRVVSREKSELDRLVLAPAFRVTTEVAKAPDEPGEQADAPPEGEVTNALPEDEPAHDVELAGEDVLEPGDHEADEGFVAHPDEPWRDPGATLFASARIRNDEGTAEDDGEPNEEAELVTLDEVDLVEVEPVEVADPERGGPGEDQVEVGEIEADEDTETDPGAEDDWPMPESVDVVEDGAGDAEPDVVDQDEPEVEAADFDQRAETLSAKIQALEAAIGQTRDQWEPDGQGNDDYSGTPVQTIEWEDHGADEADERPQVSRNTDASVQVEEPSGFLAPEETVLDEESLRELVADIVREELQGALGERITRNVRKLVRREIHRALAAQDLD